MASSRDAVDVRRVPAPARKAGIKGHEHEQKAGAVSLVAVPFPLIARCAAGGCLAPPGSSLGPLAILRLQGTNGNAHVQRLLLQRTPTVSVQDDRHGGDVRPNPALGHQTVADRRGLTVLQREPQTLEAAKVDAAAASKTVAALQKLAAARDRVELSLGKTRGGRDVNAYFFKGATTEVALVIAGVHGSELSGVEVAQTLIQLLSGKGAQKPHFSVVIVPQVFPDNVDAKRVWETSQAKAGKQLAVKAYKAARDAAKDPGRYTAGVPEADRVDPNRQFPELGKPFDPGNPVDAKGRPIERENVMLLTLIDRFKPVRIASLHAIKDPQDAGIYADPHPSVQGLPAAQKGLAQNADELATRMAEAAKQKGAKVPGNWRGGAITSLYPGQDPTISADQIARENKAGRSLGQWGPSQGAVVLTIEVNEQYASDSPVKHSGRKTELEAHAGALQEIFLGPPKGQTGALGAAIGVLGLAAAVPVAGPAALAVMAAGLGITIEQLRQMMNSAKGQPASPSGSASSGKGAPR